MYIISLSLRIRRGDKNWLSFYIAYKKAEARRLFSSHAWRGARVDAVEKTMICTS